MKVLVDTSVWISHLKRADSFLNKLLLDDRVVIHDFVEGELACGHRAIGNMVLFPIRYLNRLPTSSHTEILSFISHTGIRNSGIGFVDAHLLFSALTMNTSIYTHDKALQRVAEKLGIGTDPWQ